jgi:UDP:flavonoid glycosyltransferase YjiC (YdhE family)
MSKFLFAVVPIHGHMSPGLPIAQRLVQLGHEVVWYGTSKYHDKIEATGARFTKVQSAKITTTAVSTTGSRERAILRGLTS